jgi:hypothetical protein
MQSPPPPKNEKVVVHKIREHYPLEYNFTCYTETITTVYDVMTHSEYSHYRPHHIISRRTLR